MSNNLIKDALRPVYESVLGRSNDGSNNNAENPEWGAAFTPLERITDTTYGGDGSGVIWDAPVAPTQAIAPNAPINIGTTPQPKTISDEIFGQDSDVERPNSGGFNEFAQFFAQFATHDVVRIIPGSDGGPPVFMDGIGIPVGRTPYVIENGVRQQISEVTTFLDLSLIYGNTDAGAAILREVVTEDGVDTLGAKLESGADAGFMPTYAELAEKRGMTVEEVLAVQPGNPILPPAFTANQMVAGDARMAQTGGLIAHHVTWFRNHNWHVDELRNAYPDMSEQQIFDAARALNEAEFQQVIYGEFLTKLLGDTQLSDYEGYKADVDPSIINEWTTVAFRFGHDMTSGTNIGLSEDGTVTFDMALSQVFTLANLGQAAQDAEDLGDWVRGMSSRSTQEIDARINSGVREALFSLPLPTGQNIPLDLAALDVFRGHDHGVNSYNLLREGLGLSTYTSFEEFGAANGLDQNQIDALKSVYTDIDQMDSLVGGLLEKKFNDGQLGETFTILTVMQFEALRDGDSQFSLARFADSPEILEAIQSTSMADILVRLDVVDYAYHEAFTAHTRLGGTDGDDVIFGTGDRELMIGFDGDDLLKGKGGDDDLYGGTGADSLCGQHGDDNIFGEAGNDRLYGGWGDDYLDGGNDRDFLYGGMGDDTLHGGADNDTLYGAASNDQLNGGSGNDKLVGGWGDDTLEGGAGYDKLYGGWGKDVFVFTPGGGVDRIADLNLWQDKIDVSAYGYSSFSELRGDISRDGWFGTKIELKDSGDVVKLGYVSTWFLNEDDFIL